MRTPALINAAAEPLQPSKVNAMKKPWRRSLLALMLVPLAIGGCSSLTGWTGFGFDSSSPEMQRLRQVLELKEGMVLADVGAGKGQLSMALAREVGASGRVYSTEIDPERLVALREMFGSGGVGNVSVVEAKARETGLPASCCDAIVMRRVYHHLSEPKSVNSSLLQSVRPGGLLVVIDMPPPFGIRGELGVPVQTLIDEVRSSGFELVRSIEDWPGRGPMGSYCAVFRRPSGQDGTQRPAEVPASNRTSEPAVRDGERRTSAAPTPTEPAPRR